MRTDDVFLWQRASNKVHKDTFQNWLFAELSIDRTPVHPLS